MPDLYDSYADLAAGEAEGIHYRIRVIDRASPIAIVAPHGGRIEAGTSQTAALIAADVFSLYCFEGLVSGRRLHITSARFDEPRALALVEASDIAIGVHGRADRGDHRTIWLGGLHESLRDAIGAALERVGFKTSTDHHMQGKAPGNICNRGRLRAGVQLELPMSLRNAFLNDAFARQAFGSAVRDTIVTETVHD
ncbi:MAG: poly-gamma-glutamate hydrolase family protein [Methylocystis sp.]